MNLSLKSKTSDVEYVTFMLTVSIHTVNAEVVTVFKMTSLINTNKLSSSRSNVCPLSLNVWVSFFYIRRKKTNQSSMQCCNMEYGLFYSIHYRISTVKYHRSETSVRALLTFGGLFDIADKKNVHQ